jgi:cytochrome c
MGIGRPLDPFELNKVAGAFLGTLLFAMVLNLTSGAIFSRTEPAKPGYLLPSVQEEAAPGTNATATPAPPPIEERLARADVKKGEADIKACQACHNFEKGGGSKIGPPLYGVIGRSKGSVAGFAYSEAIKSKGGKWTDPTNSSPIPRLTPKARKWPSRVRAITPSGPTLSTICTRYRTIRGTIPLLSQKNEKFR